MEVYRLHMNAEDQCFVFVPGTRSVPIYLYWGPKTKKSLGCKNFGRHFLCLRKYHIIIEYTIMQKYGYIHCKEEAYKGDLASA